MKRNHIDNGNMQLGSCIAKQTICFVTQIHVVSHFPLVQVFNSIPVCFMLIIMLACCTQQRWV